MKKKNKFIIIGLAGTVIAIIAVYLVLFDSNVPYAGTYYMTEEGNDFEWFLELHSDRTTIRHAPYGTYAGTWKVVEGHIEVTQSIFGAHEYLIYEITEDGLVDEEGNVWKER